MKFQATIEEAMRVLEAHGLEEVQKALRITDDQIIEILLDNYPRWQSEIMQWYSEYLISCSMEEAERRFHG